MLQRNRSLARLTAVAVRNAKESGVYQDSGGLRLVLTPAKTRQWAIRITVNGKRRDVGLGGYPAVSLDNPCTGVARMLGATPREKGNFRSLPYTKIAAFVKALRQRAGDPASRTRAHPYVGSFVH